MAVINTTNDYENALILNIKNSKFNMVVLYNNSNNAALYKIHATLDKIDDTTNGVWYELLSENTLEAQSRVVYRLTDPWNFLLLKVKSKVTNNHATLYIARGGY